MIRCPTCAGEIATPPLPQVQCGTCGSAVIVAKERSAETRRILRLVGAAACYLAGTGIVICLLFWIQLDLVARGVSAPPASMMTNYIWPSDLRLLCTWLGLLAVIYAAGKVLSLTCRPRGRGRTGLFAYVSPWMWVLIGAWAVGIVLAAMSFISGYGPRWLLVSAVAGVQLKGIYNTLGP